MNLFHPAWELRKQRKPVTVRRKKEIDLPRGTRVTDSLIPFPVPIPKVYVSLASFNLKRISNVFC